MTDDVHTMPSFDPCDLIGRTFLKEKGNEVHRIRPRRPVIEVDHDGNESLKYLCVNEQTSSEEIISYNEILDFIDKNSEDENDGERVWRFKQIISHQGPLKPGDPNYKGSMWNVMLEGDSGEVTPEPLAIIGQDDPVTCALYAEAHGLLDPPGWKRFKRLARRKKKMLRMLNQAKLKAFRRGPIYKFGFEVPQTHADVLRIDAKCKNTCWQDSERLELSQLDEYNTFIDKGVAKIDSKGRILNPPEGYKKICCRIVYDVKHDGRHKSRFVAGGHLTEVPVDSVYSGVVSYAVYVFVCSLRNLTNSKYGEQTSVMPI
jgi:hypothetical protein